MSYNPYGPGDPAYPSSYNTQQERQQQQQYQNYPPPHNELNPSYTNTNISSSTVVGLGATGGAGGGAMNMKETELDVDVGRTGREVSRTPSPTPSEEAELKRTGLLDWKMLMKWRFWIRREWLWYYVVGLIITVISVLVAIYDKQIVHKLEPIATKIKDLPAGYLIPIAIMFIISFPPLFGHEIVAIICGLVWGLWIGFAIVAVGTYLGEVGNFYAFKYCCRARGEKLEKTNIQYGCLAKIVREGGFIVPLVARFSAIPGHFTTAVFSTCGMNIFVFSIAAILSLPKQFVVVYIGVVLDQAGTGKVSSKNRIIQDSILVITFAITGLAMWWIYRKMNAVKPAVIYARRKARQGKLDRAGLYPYSSSSPTLASSSNFHNADGDSNENAFNPRESDSDLPLTADPSVRHSYQRWDKQGNAVGYSPDPRLYAPSPRRAEEGMGAERLRFSGEGRGGSGGASPAGMRERPYAPQQQQQQQQRQQQRQESADAVGWEMQNQGMGADAYHLPQLKPHTPLSGGFPAAAGGQSGQGQGQGQGQYQQQHHPSALAPAHGPPHLAAGQLVDPFASTETLSGGGGGGLGQSASQVPYAVLPPSQPTLPTQPQPQPQQQQQPPAQYANRYSLSDTGPLPSPQFHLGKGQGHTGQQHTQAPSEATFYTVPQGQHSVEPSELSYYTASDSHSRGTTEDGGVSVGGVSGTHGSVPPSYRSRGSDEFI